MVRSAKALPRLPSTAAAFAAGEISDAHVASIANVTASMSAETLSEGVEELLLSEARRLTPSKFASAAATIRDRVIAPSERPDLRPRTPDRFLRARLRADGRMSMSAMFDGPTGRALIGRLDDFARASCPGVEVPLLARRAESMAAMILGPVGVRRERTDTTDQVVTEAVDADFGATASTDPSPARTPPTRSGNASSAEPTKNGPAAPEGSAPSSARKARGHRSKHRRRHPSAQRPMKR
jgi:hypothetical protein